MLSVAILDDYQHCAESIVDWSSVKSRASLTFYHDTLPNQDPPSLALIDRLKPYEIIVTMRERTPFSASLLKSLPNLKLLCTGGMVNLAIDVEAANKTGVTVCGTGPNLGRAATNELNWALILSLLRFVPHEDHSMRTGGYQHTIGTVLSGKTLALLGLGRLGIACAKIAKAFDMKVIAWSPNLTEERCREVEGLDINFCSSKAELFRQADVLSIHMVLSPTTRGLIRRDELRSMKPTSILVNTSRGPIIDDQALVTALKEKWIAGAALDVFQTEPLPVDHPLRGLKNTVLTPHIVSQILGYLIAATKTCFEGLRDNRGL
jgi:lactate dehydrogenase-like 2-hydroxyacid dehydrogenase